MTLKQPRPVFGVPTAVADFAALLFPARNFNRKKREGLESGDIPFPRVE